MNTATMILAIVPVVILMAFILLIVKEKVLDHGEGSIDIKNVVGVLAVVLIAVVLMGSMIGDSIEYYDYDEQKGELTITYAVAERSSYPWDSYASDVRSLVIEDGVESIAAGAFSSLTGLEYVSISEGVESISPAAFGVSVEDYMGQTLASVASGEYAGIGDGTVYLCDESLFTYSTNGASITGLTDAGSKHLVFPAKHNGVTITNVGYQAIASKTALETAVFLPGSGVTTFSNGVFKGCTALTHAILPKSIQTFNVDAFQNCSSLVSIDLPEGMTAMGASCFLGCTSLESVTLPGSMTDMGNYAFNGCSALKAITFPARVSAIGINSFTNCSSMTTVVIPSTITEVKADAFRGCTGVTSVTFGGGFNATLGSNCFVSWTFYESDGTTTIDKTVASNLAGKTFMGTAAALVEVAPGQLSLTPQQFQQVQLHTQELQQQELDIQPLPFQPTVQTQDQEPASA